MILTPSVYTATMARVLAEQGYLRKAAEVYHYLLAREPGRDDLRKALADLEHRLAEQAGPSLKDAQLLLREWSQALKENYVTLIKRRSNAPRDTREIMPAPAGGAGAADDDGRMHSTEP